MIRFFALDQMIDNHQNRMGHSYNRSFLPTPTGQAMILSRQVGIPRMRRCVSGLDQDRIQRFSFLRPPPPFCYARHATGISRLCDDRFPFFFHAEWTVTFTFRSHHRRFLGTFHAFLLLKHSPNPVTANSNGKFQTIRPELQGFQTSFSSSRLFLSILRSEMPAILSYSSIIRFIHHRGYCWRTPQLSKRGLVKTCKSGWARLSRYLAV